MASGTIVLGLARRLAAADHSLFSQTQRSVYADFLWLEYPGISHRFQISYHAAVRINLHEPAKLTVPLRSTRSSLYFNRKYAESRMVIGWRLKYDSVGERADFDVDGWSGRANNLRLNTLARQRPLIILLAWATILASCGTSSTTNSTGTTTPSSVSAPAITSQPSSQTVTVGQTATFTVVATGTAPLTYQWQKNSANISGATSASYTTVPTSAADNGSMFQVVVGNSAGSVTSAAALLTVNSPSSSNPPPSQVNVLTFHNDNGRTGQNLNETILTPANVSSANFGKIGFLNVSGLVDAEPLYVSNLMVGGSSHNVVFVVTEQDMVYAFDGDTFAQLWSTSVLGANEAPSDDHDCYQITPNIGITSTPVIDLAAGPHGTIFLVAMSKDSNGNYYQRLHALDISTGSEQTGSPTTISATFPGTAPYSVNGQDIFDPGQYAERSALLLLNGVIYMGWTSHCDTAPYTGWIMGYSEASLQQTSVINVTPNGSEGSIWMSGGGLAADSSGNIYFLDANGTFDTTLNSSGMPISGDYGNSFIKLSTNGGVLAVSDYFAMHNTVAESNSDSDLGSGGVLLLPDQTDSTGKVWHLAVGAGKDANLYVVNRDAMGGFNANNDNAIYQELTNVLGETVFASPAYFHNTLYYAAVGQTMIAININNAALVALPSSYSHAYFLAPGATPSISANGASNGIVWAVENNSGPGILYAFDATNLQNELYGSDQAGSRDLFQDNKFITPMIANGKVYVGTPTGVAVFGLLIAPTRTASTPARQMDV